MQPRSAGGGQPGLDLVVAGARLPRGGGPSSGPSRSRRRGDNKTVMRRISAQEVAIVGYGVIPDDRLCHALGQGISCQGGYWESAN